MFFDLAPRSSGKTTRLINAIEAYLKENTTHRAIVRARAAHISEGIINQLPPDMKCRARISVSSVGYTEVEGEKLFCDEYFSIPKNKRIVSKNGYYCSSPEWLYT